MMGRGRWGRRAWGQLPASRQSGWLPKKSKYSAQVCDMTNLSFILHNNVGKRHHGRVDMVYSVIIPNKPRGSEPMESHDC